MEALPIEETIPLIDPEILFPCIEAVASKKVGGYVVNVFIDDFDFSFEIYDDLDDEHASHDYGPGYSDIGSCLSAGIESAQELLLLDNDPFLGMENRVLIQELEKRGCVLVCVVSADNFQEYMEKINEGRKKKPVLSDARAKELVEQHFYADAYSDISGDFIDELICNEFNL